MKFGLNKCETCNGTGMTERYPYYAKVMPEKHNLPCIDCRGKGEYYVVPEDIVVIRRGNLLSSEFINFCRLVSENTKSF